MVSLQLFDSKNPRYPLAYILKSRGTQWTTNGLQRTSSGCASRQSTPVSDAAGIVSVDGSEEPATTALDAQRFADWIAKGRAGEMDYLKRRDDNGTLLRSAVQVAVPWARSVVVCALNYNAAAPLSIDPAPLDTGWIARYAWSGQPDPANPDALLPTDYHNQLLTRLRSVESAIQQRFAAQDIETRCYVDTGPLVERTAAARAGIGWIGKNTCVINQQLGSWLLLGVVITSIPVGGDAVFSIAEDRCGSCTRCVRRLSHRRARRAVPDGCLALYRLSHH
ncbi:MAG: QueG-associated DUF1730 domain-containing protein [Edaphobacter sp.]